MFTRKRFATGGCLLALGLAITLVRAADPPTAGWSDVRQAINQGLPKTAIEKLDADHRAGDGAEAVRRSDSAIGQKIALEGNIQGNKPEEKIIRMRAEIDKAPRGNEAGHERDAGQLVLALLPAKPLAVHAADANFGSAERRFHHLGLAADLERDRQAVSSNTWPTPRR